MANNTPKACSIANMPDEDIIGAAEEFGSQAAEKMVTHYASHFKVQPDEVRDVFELIIKEMTTKAFTAGLRVARNVQQECEKGMN